METFEAAAAAHVRALLGRDLQGYAATLHEDASLILPGGRQHVGRAAVTAFHEQLFADPGWTQELTLLRTAACGDAAVATYRSDFRPADGPATAMLVVLTFARSGDGWLLLSDQCTRLAD